MAETRRIPIWLFGVTAAASLGTVAGSYAFFGLNETGYGLAARYTVRVSFPLFLLAYLARPLARLWRHDASRWLLRNRRYLGLSFALAHTIHLAAFTALFVHLGVAPGIETLIGGGGAYLVMFLMAATSNNASLRTLGPNWRRLHLFGMHYLWFIFAFSYFGRLAETRGEGSSDDLTLVGLVGTAICLLALLVRGIAYLQTRTRAAVT